MSRHAELVALLHSFVGLAAVLVGFSSHLSNEVTNTIHSVEVVIAVAIGQLPTGSIVAG